MKARALRGPTGVWVLLMLATLAGFGTAQAAGVGFALAVLAAVFKAHLIARHPHGQDLFQFIRFPQHMGRNQDHAAREPIARLGNQIPYGPMGVVEIIFLYMTDAAVLRAQSQVFGPFRGLQHVDPLY